MPRSKKLSVTVDGPSVVTFVYRKRGKSTIYVDPIANASDEDPDPPCAGCKRPRVDPKINVGDFVEVRLDPVHVNQDEFDQTLSDDEYDPQIGHGLVQEVDHKNHELTVYWVFTATDLKQRYADAHPYVKSAMSTSYDTIDIDSVSRVITSEADMNVIVGGRYVINAGNPHIGSYKKSRSDVLFSKVLTMANRQRAGKEHRSMVDTRLEDLVELL